MLIASSMGSDWGAGGIRYNDAASLGAGGKVMLIPTRRTDETPSIGGMSESR